MNDRSSHPRFAFLVASLALFALGCATLEGVVPVPSPSVAPLPTLVLTNSASTFDHNTLAGQQAPGFTLPAANGQDYTFAANDARKHVLVFYMVYT